jgi:ATP-dependent DNA helicase RecG
MQLTDPINILSRTSPLTIKKFLALDINTIYELINYVPFRYEDYSVISKINQLQEGETVTIQGTILEAKNVFTRSGLKMQKVKISDETGKTEIVWYNQPYLIQNFKTGMKISVAGTVKRFLHTYSLEPKEYEIIGLTGAPTIHTGRIVPIYPEKLGLSSRIIREKILQILQKIEAEPALTSGIEWLPEPVISFNKLSEEWQAYKDIHFPKTLEDAKKARQRLAFDELFIIQLSASLIKKQWQKETVTHAFDIQGKKPELDTFTKSLPFSLTGAQSRTVQEILTDLSKSTPMNRFVQGDVGSGKTVVAAIAAYAAFLNGFQTLIMAPTEILAEQHFKTISALFQKYPLKIGLQTGSKKMVKKDEKFDIIIGTQALITKSLQFERIGLVVVDEQHRFGVAQRAALKQKGINPHLLTMTATPIPRTVALTLYGELDLSEINEMPKGRIPIKTYLTPPEKRNSAYEWIRKQIKTTDSQVFIICPLIEESEVETMKSIRAAKKEYEHLKHDIFKDFNVTLLHGKMKAKEKNDIMAEFKDKNITFLFRRVL